MQERGLELHLRLALERFDLELDLNATGQVTGLFGPSGAGKTSVLETVAGIRRGARGLVRHDGVTWLDTETGFFLPPERRQVGHVPQDGLLFPHLSVRENLAYGTSRTSPADRPSPTLADVSELLDLRPLWDRDVATLSGGERQRVALGRALCSKPRLLLLDEPLASLDLPTRRRLLPLLRQLRDELDIPVLLVSHDPVEVQALCDDVIALRDGREIGRGSPRDVLSDPRVFSLAAERTSHVNVLIATHVRADDDTSAVRVGDGAGAVTLVTRRSESPTGSELLVELPANEILVATEEPRGLSARNVIPGTVSAVRADDGLVVVEMSAGLPPLIVEVTARTCAELDLAPGRPAYLVFKATSCGVL